MDYFYRSKQNGYYSWNMSWNKAFFNYSYLADIIRLRKELKMESRLVKTYWEF